MGRHEPILVKKCGGFEFFWFCIVSFFLSLSPLSISKLQNKRTNAIATTTTTTKCVHANHVCRINVQARARIYTA